MNLNDLNIRYIGDFAPGTGYNTAMRGYLKCLEHLGLDAGNVRGVPAISMSTVSSIVRMPTGDGELSIHPDGPGGVFQGADGMPDNDWTFQYLHGEWDEEPNLNIVHTHVRYLGHFWTAGMYNIAIVTWETDKLPIAAWRDSFDQQHTVVEDINKFDEVWVPTEWNRKLLLKSDVTVPVHVIPHAILPELQELPYMDRPTEEVAFYHMGTWNARKDPETLLHAWFTTGWNPLDRVDLSLFCVPPSRDSLVVDVHGNQAKAALEAIQSSLPESSAAPQYGLHTVYVDYEEVLRRHQGCHVLVSASHGEGFFLPALEAAAFGNWVIGGGPWLEELAEVAGRVENGGLIDILPVRKVPITTVQGVWGYEPGQKWWSVDVDDLRDAMVSARHGLKEEDMMQEEEAALQVRKHYSVERIAGLMRERLLKVENLVQETGW